MILFYWEKFFFTSLNNNPDHANEHWQSMGNRCYSQMVNNLGVVNLHSGGYISLKVFYSQLFFFFLLNNKWVLKYFMLLFQLRGILMKTKEIND